MHSAQTVAGMEVDSAIELGGGGVILHGDQSKVASQKTPSERQRMNHEADWDPGGILRKAAEKEARARVNPPWSNDPYWSEAEVMKRFNSKQTAEEFFAELERFEKEKREYYERKHEEFHRKAAAQRTPRPEETLLPKVLNGIVAAVSLIFLVVVLVAIIYALSTGRIYVDPEDGWGIWKG